MRGVKNFWIFSISISAFICTKNYQKIFKTRECRLVCANVYICAESGKKSSSFKSDPPEKVRKKIVPARLAPKAGPKYGLDSFEIKWTGFA